MLKIYFVSFFLTSFLFSFSEFKISDFRDFLFKSKNMLVLKDKLETKAQRFNGKVDIKFSFDDFNDVSKHGELAICGDGYIGKAAKFLTPENVLTYTNLTGDFFNKYPDIGNFTIDFYFKLNTISGGQVFFRRWGPVLDNQSDEILSQGFIVELRGGRVRCQFDNFFHFNEKNKSVILEAGSIATPRKWHHVIITYSVLTGVLSKYLDEKLEESFFVTSDATEDGTVFYPSFLKENKHPLVFGEGMSGYLDEVKFYFSDKDGSLISKYPDSKSLYISKVFPIEKHINLKRIKISDVVFPSKVNVFFRASKDYFTEENQNIDWQIINKSDLELKDLVKDIYYLQFRIDLFNYNIKEANVIRDFVIQYERDLPPVTPQILSYQVFSKKIKIVWERGPESDLLGYKIYFKLKKSHKVNVLTLYLNDLKKNTFSNSYGGENITYTYDLLENDKLYQFYMTSFDEIGAFHESIPTKKIDFVPDRFVLERD